MAPTDPPSTPETRTARRLTELSVGQQGRLLSAELQGPDLDLLRALGFTERSPFRLCQAGNPWIVQVRGTRIGLSDEVAAGLRVMPEGVEGPTTPAANGAGA